MGSVRQPIWLPYAAAAVCLASCDSDKAQPSQPAEQGQPPQADEIVPSCGDVATGEAFASDESFTKFIEAEAADRLITEDCPAPVLTVPVGGATLDRSTPPTFTFMPTQPACAQAMAPAAPVRRERSRSWGPRACPPRPRGLWARIWKMISPIGVAEAHCPAVEGPNYLLRILDAKDKVIYTALLSLTSFTPKEETWRRIMSGRGGQVVKVSIEGAMFVRGNILDGPFVSKQPVSLNVAR